MTTATLDIALDDEIKDDNFSTTCNVERPPIKAANFGRYTIGWVRRSTTVDAVEVISGSPWLASAIQKVSRLKSLNAAWADEGISPPNETAISFANQALGYLSEIEFQPKHIDPSPDEGVCLSFEAKGKRANIEFFNTGEIFAAAVGENEIPNIWEISPMDIRNTVASLSKFICD